MAGRRRSDRAWRSSTNNPYETLEGILVERVPEDQRARLVFHAAEIYSGNGKDFGKKRFPYWTWDKRAAILADLARLSEQLNLQVTRGMYFRKDAPYA